MNQPEGTVTLVFTDIEGSTRLLHELGQDAYRKALGEHRRVVREAFARHDGYEVDYEGDAFFYAFTSAREAVQAVAEAQGGLARGPIQIRVGIHTGEPVPDPPKYVGADVHLAARVMSSGHGGQVLLSGSTRALVDEDVRDLGKHRLKDFDEPVAIYQLGQGSFAPLKTISNTNLPRPVSSFVGREREVAEVALLLRGGARLVTLSGPGGSGKTRLSIEAASEVLGDFPGGVFWIGLVAVRDPELVPDTIGQTLGAKDDVAGHIGEKRLMLVLDNLEQVVDAAPTLADLLGACPNLQLLATSRELLRIQGERDYPVLPLAAPEAIELFRDRSQLEPDATVAELCARLDNLPLAVELAAARTRVLTPAQILERLTQRLDLLRGGRDVDPRQQTLRAAIEWSHELLRQPEQELFARLAVFTGGCGLEAAEDVVGADLDTLQSLVDKSLVRRGDDRFWMLETIREYAAERLEASGEGASLRRRHADFFAALAEDVDLRARTADQSTLYERLSADDANLRQALEWTRDHEDTELELRLATALSAYWSARGYVREGLLWLDDALGRVEDPPPRAVLGHFMLRYPQTEGYEGLLTDVKQALPQWEKAGDDHLLAQAWNLIGTLEGSGLGRFAVAEEAWGRALDYAERGNHAAEGAEAMGWLMIMAVFGELPTDQGIERCNRFFERAGHDEKVRAFARVERSVLEAMRGNFDVARSLLAEGHRTFEALGLNMWAANNAQEVFHVEMLAGNPVAAAEALRASYEDFERMGERGFNSTIAGMLANVLEDLRLDDEAEHFSRESERLAAADDYYSQSLWRGALGKVLARRGILEQAETLAQAAVDILPPEMLMARAYAYYDLAVVLRAVGRREEAHEAAAEAARLHERKGNLVAVEDARRLAAELAG